MNQFEFLVHGRFVGSMLVEVSVGAYEFDILMCMQARGFFELATLLMVPRCWRVGHILLTHWKATYSAVMCRLFMHLKQVEKSVCHSGDFQAPEHFLTWSMLYCRASPYFAAPLERCSLAGSILQKREQIGSAMRPIDLSVKA